MYYLQSCALVTTRQMGNATKCTACCFATSDPHNTNKSGSAHSKAPHVVVKNSRVTRVWAAAQKEQKNRRCQSILPSLISQRTGRLQDTREVKVGARLYELAGRRANAGGGMPGKMLGKQGPRRAPHTLRCLTPRGHEAGSRVVRIASPDGNADGIRDHRLQATGGQDMRIME